MNSTFYEANNIKYLTDIEIAFPEYWKVQTIRILGTGSYVPPKRLTNADLQNMGSEEGWPGEVRWFGGNQLRFRNADCGFRIFNGG